MVESSGGLIFEIGSIEDAIKEAREKSSVIRRGIVIPQQISGVVSIPFDSNLPFKLQKLLREDWQLLCVLNNSSDAVAHLVKLNNTPK